MCRRPYKLLVLLATSSGLIFIAALFLPTMVVAFILPPAGLIVGVGSMWNASRVLTLVVAGLVLPAIFAPCARAKGRRWLFPLAVTALVVLTLILMTVQAVFLGGEFGFALTVIGYVVLVVLALCTLFEAIVARCGTTPAESVS